MKTKSDERIRIAHFSDLHFSNENLPEVGKCFESAVTSAIERNVELAIVTGDSTDYKQDAHSPALHALIRQVQRLANHCPVLMLQGTFSHEPAGMLDLFRYVGGKYSIEVVDKIGQLALVGATWKPVRAPADVIGARLVVSCLPTMNKADLVDSVGAAQVDEAMGDVLAAIVGGVFAPLNRAARQAGVPTIFLGHGTVSGSVTESGVPMVGLDHEFTTGGIFGAMSCAAMLGHIHRHQMWEREFDGVQQKIAYAGSIGRNHYGEEGQKGFLVWDVGVNDTGFEFCPTPACVMIDLDFVGAPDLEYLKEQAPSCRGAFVRVRYEIDAEFAASVDRKAILEILAEAKEVQIKGRVMPSERRRCAGISRLGTLAEKIEKWCEATDNDKSVLVHRVQMVTSGDPKAIAAQILEGVFNETSRAVGIESGACVGTVRGANVEPIRYDEARDLEYCDEHILERT